MGCQWKLGSTGRARAQGGRGGLRRDLGSVDRASGDRGDVEGGDIVLVDDMIDTAGTICQAAQVLKERGAHTVLAVTTHPVLSGPAIQRLSETIAIAISTS